MHTSKRLQPYKSHGINPWPATTKPSSRSGSSKYATLLRLLFCCPSNIATNLKPQATGFPNPTNQTMIDMVDHWLYSWSRHRSLQWTARSKNNRRNSPLTVISKSVLNFNGTFLPTTLLYHRNTCATAGRIEIGARLWDQSPLPILL